MSPHRNKAVDKDQKPHWKKVQIWWMHYNVDQQRYVPVRMLKGGGTRYVDMPFDSNIENVLQVASSIYFPGGVSFCRSLDDMNVDIGNYKGDVISILKMRMALFTNFLWRNIMKLAGQIELGSTKWAVFKIHPWPTPVAFPKDKKDEEKKKLSGNNAILIEDDEFSDSDLYNPTFLDNDYPQDYHPVKEAPFSLSRIIILLKFYCPKLPFYCPKHPIMQKLKKRTKKPTECFLKYNTLTNLELNNLAEYLKNQATRKMQLQSTLDIPTRDCSQDPFLQPEL